MDDDALLHFLRDRFALDWRGVHGIAHWTRVRENGLRLADTTGANRRVVEFFALFHDSCRQNDGSDPRHGARGAELARELAGSSFEIAPEDLELLVTACRDHTRGFTTGDATVLTCWDADRLDLGRVGIRPRAGRLCTEAARDPKMIAWAYERSILD